MRPFYLKAPVKDYIWGGTRLRELFGKEGGDRLAESWELSCHPDGECYIMGGEFDGMKLSDFVNEHPEAVGSGFKSGDSFPVLVKLIDAKNDLSVQVHPNDEYAHKYENDNGKTEMWYVIDAAPDSELIYGFNEELSKEDFRKAIENNTLMEKLRRVPVKQGDVFFIEPGTLHAIGKGILIAEIQQSSNVTYRVYDYGRLGADGKPRPLHIEKALEVINTKPLDPERPVYGLELDGVVTQLLADCKYFNVNRHRLIKELELYADKNSFAHVLMIGGSGGELVADNHRLELTMGSRAFVPAGTGAFAIKGNCDVIVTTLQ